MVMSFAWALYGVGLLLTLLWGLHWLIRNDPSYRSLELTHSTLRVDRGLVEIRPQDIL